ncbi:MAG TPA: ribbon-helix-helix protein, CopG family [Bryobacteraceae bacterium]|jgi:hypothetical protein|nr:ribbon-helix-helix protein, CopG family [Bryobacteraceae bacterium]
MVRTQVQLTEQQLETLRQLAAESGKSIAELVRLGVELYLAAQLRPNRKEQVERARRIAGQFSSGMRDVSTHHDRHLSEAYRG